MDQLFRLAKTQPRDPAIDAWLAHRNGDPQHDELRAMAACWFEVLRNCGDDVREILHDGHPTACVGDAAFAYVAAFKAHVNVGFFRGVELAEADATGLLEGIGKLMRHVKLRPEPEVDERALANLIQAAYSDMKSRL